MRNNRISRSRVQERFSIGFPLSVVLASAAMITPLFQPRPALADGFSARLVILDVQGDDVDGAGLASTMDAYLSGLGVVTELVVVTAPPADHADWIALAGSEGRTRTALAVVWIERTATGDDSLDVYLVLFELVSGALVVLPVELGLRRGPAAWRVLAATTRMLLETEVLEAIRDAGRMARRDPTPDPWPSAAITDRAAERLEIEHDESDLLQDRRSLDLHLAYYGTVKASDGAVLHGGRTGITFMLSSVLGLDLGVSYSTTAQYHAADLELREQRVPISLGLSVLVPLKGTEIAASASWMGEAVWIAAESNDPSRPEVEKTSVLDTGGGLGIGIRAPVSGGFGLTAEGGVQIMAVSHVFYRRDEVAIHSSPFRAWWSLGICWRGL